MHNSPYAILMALDLGENIVQKKKKNSTHFTLHFEDKGRKATPAFLSSYLLNTCTEQWQDGESALSLKSLLIGLLSA